MWQDRVNCLRSTLSHASERFKDMKSLVMAANGQEVISE